MSDELHPPSRGDDGHCNMHERTRFDTEVASRINGYGKAIKTLEEEVEALVTIKNRVYGGAALVVFLFAMITGAFGLYLKAAIQEELRPIHDQLAQMKSRDEINRVLIKPESLSERIDSLKTTIYGVDDKVRAMNDRLERVEKRK